MRGCVDVLARVHADGGYPTNWPADPARWLTPSGLIEAWVAGTGEIPVAGHAIISQVIGRAHCPPAAEIGRLFVDPAARRQGIAQALLQHAKEWAAVRDVDLVLWVTDHLTAARTLYEGAGFTLTETAVADWTAPDGSRVTVHRYYWPQDGRAAPRNR